MGAAEKAGMVLADFESPHWNEQVASLGMDMSQGAGAGMWSGSAAVPTDVTNIAEGGNELEMWMAANNVDGKAAEILRNQEPRIQALVLARGPATGRSPNAIVTARVNKACAGESLGGSTSASPKPQ